MPRFSHSLPLLATLLAAPLLAQAPADVALDRAVARYNGVRSMKATFEQTISNPITGSVVSARGEMLVQRPGRIAIRFTDPAGDQIVSDGKRMWVYLPSSAPGQVIRTDASAQGGLDIAGELLTAPRAKFDVTDGGTATVAGRATRILVLVPKSERAFTRARLWVDQVDGSVRQLELTEPSGLTRLIAFRTVTLNAKVPASAFTFKVPKGARVVDG
jgi:outer membrane lipoprotein carrier protein